MPVRVAYDHHIGPSRSVGRSGIEIWKELEEEWLSSGCIESAADADVVLFYAGEDERQCGALLECGAALAAGKHVFVVSPHEWTFANHQRCRRFDSLEAAIRAIKALEAGETARVIAAQ